MTAGAGLTRTASDLSVNIDASTIEIDADSLRVKDAGITNAKLANSSVTVTAGSALTGGGAVALGALINLDVAVDDSTIEVSADALRVKNAGITTAKINDAAVTNIKLANSAVTVTAGSALTGGGSVALGSSVNLDVAVDGSTTEPLQACMSDEDLDEDRDEDRDEDPDREVATGTLDEEEEESMDE
jgi:hypothetical protein